MSRAVITLLLAVALVPAAAAQPMTPMLSVASTSTKGALPHTVTFSLHAPKAISWRLDFGDGQFETAKGPPPATVTHVYRTNASFVAHLSTVYPSVTTETPAPKTKVVAQKPNPVPPVTLTGPLVILGVVPGSADSPRTVYFTLASRLIGNVTSWRLVFGDGKTASGKGAPPSSVAHTYARGGTFRASVVLSEASADRYARVRIPPEGLSVTVP
jgi:PKD repeat protein